MASVIDSMRVGVRVCGYVYIIHVCVHACVYVYTCIANAVSEIQTLAKLHVEVHM